MHACRLAIYALHTLGANTLWRTREAVLWASAADKKAKQKTKDRVWADAFRGRVLSATSEIQSGSRLLHRAMGLARELNDDSAFWFAATMFLQTLERAVPVPAWVGEQRDVALELANRSRKGVSANIQRTSFLFTAWAFLFFRR
jgi:hypothetical protein